ncbi:hypothetical protein HanOQP8_Chr04g0140221 [Helianthus annuus]|nr:hypothetical protein HanIR_Chr04g0167231 [Helianthus annuus]KAJ0756896.1 hypothetical protein HanLR1_Chr04g0132331 [Helianthus annuus]KAJ0760631.1 hypothetical protein HanOQP8_Chr04g0140221 [Helianthus annuus]
MSDDEFSLEIMPETDSELEEDLDFMYDDAMSRLSNGEEVIALGGDALMDDVLELGGVLGPDVVIIGHPGGDLVLHLILEIPPLTMLAPYVDVPAGGDEIPVFHVDYVNDDLGEGEDFDIAILEVSSPVVSVMEITSSGSIESVSSSALRAVGLSAYPTDVSSISEPVTPTTVEMGGPSHSFPTRVGLRGFVSLGGSQLLRLEDLRVLFPRVLLLRGFELLVFVFPRSLRRVDCLNLHLLCLLLILLSCSCFTTHSRGEDGFFCDVLSGVYA